MVDTVTPETRSRMMSGIRGKHTKPEIIVRKALFAAGYRFRLHRRELPGAPDIVLPGKKVAIFVHGCFWHMHADCKNAKVPATRPAFWRAKLEGNVDRDCRVIEALHAMGWRVLVAWECATRDAATVAEMPELLTAWIKNGAVFGEISVEKRE
jgi:DNA mismatch endonuclease (patch repair protein)